MAISAFGRLGRKDCTGTHSFCKGLRAGSKAKERRFSPQNVPSSKDILEQGGVGVAVADCPGWEVRRDKG